MAQPAPGKWFREGINLIELTERFADETSAVKWFEDSMTTIGICESD